MSLWTWMAFVCIQSSYTEGIEYPHVLGSWSTGTERPFNEVMIKKAPVCLGTKPHDGGIELHTLYEGTQDDCSVS